MPLILFLLFVIIPALEIAVFIQIGSLIGVLPTLLGIVVTAVVGAWVVRYQGLKVLSDAQTALEKHTVPVEPVLHGVFILIAGVLLMTPGYVTDTMGALLLIPPLRLVIAHHLWNWIRTRANVTIVGGGATARWSNRDEASEKIIEAQATDITDDDVDKGISDSNSPWSDKRS